MTRKTLLSLALLAVLAGGPGARLSRADDGAQAVATATVERRQAADPQVGRSFEIPYRLTLTNHYLVRVRVNGKGPFNFLVDTGAPFLFVSTDVAKQVGIEPSKTSYFTKVDRLDLEGGATLKGINARVDDPFQLVGMNALGLPGASIDGILGFNVLARYRMEFDPRRDRMNWTRLDYEPRDPFVPANASDRQAPAEVQAMNMLGPAMKLMSAFVGKQPEDVLLPQGLIGLELAHDGEAVKVAAVLPGSPAAEAGVRADDILLEVHDETVEALDAAHAAVAKLRAGDRVRLVLKRGDETIELHLNAAEGF